MRLWPHFYFIENSENRVVDFGAVAVKVLYLFRQEARVKREETGVKFFVEGGLVKRGGRKVHQRRRDRLPDSSLQTRVEAS